MKVQCDVCEKANASVLCCPDEAALCTECDRKIHTANKLAEKHQRVALIHSSSEETTRCDICQEKTGYIFCLEDRALLCRCCDYSIHSTNKFAAKHRRFLVPAIQVALEASLITDETTDAARVCALPEIQVAKTKETSCAHMSNIPKFVHSNSNGRLNDSQDLFSITSSLKPQASSIFDGHENHIINDQKNDSGREATTVQMHGNTKAIPRVEVSEREALTVLQPHTRAVSMNSFNQQVHMTTNWDMQDQCKEGTLNDNVNVVSTQADERENSTMRSTISEYLTETIPGWRVDELLSFPDMLSTVNLLESSPIHQWHCRSTPWYNGYSTEEALVPGPAEVPTSPFVSTSSSAQRATRFWAHGKPIKPTDCIFEYDNAFTVPDVGGTSYPAVHAPSPLKRKGFGIDS
ncbi:hypothetical protein KP509_24G058800 [Ceratopteris richardii]|uniref:B box-type domain-containing protein n=1 Tax=Ceratopteris richardii TaxID=49495 RepID=A0A8T2RXQ5_CERRI|nr:hypothetical protein KP509_24G058800 [Ceratopteris richardii]